MSPVGALKHGMIISIINGNYRISVYLMIKNMLVVFRAFLIL